MVLVGHRLTHIIQELCENTQCDCRSDAIKLQELSSIAQMVPPYCSLPTHSGGHFVPVGLNAGASGCSQPKICFPDSSPQPFSCPAEPPGRDHGVCRLLLHCHPRPHRQHVAAAWGQGTCCNACTSSQSSAPAGCRVQWSDGWLMMGARKASPKEDMGNDRRQKCIWLRCGAQVGSDTPGEQRARWERRRGILNMESGPGTHHAAHAPAHACWGIRLQH